MKVEVEGFTAGITLKSSRMKNTSAGITGGPARPERGTLTIQEKLR